MTGEFFPREIVSIAGFRAGAKEIDNVYTALCSHQLSYGYWSKKYETDFAIQHQVKHALFCNSGTSALEMGLMALKEKYGWKDGDEVLVPAITFVASVNMILRCGLTPVLVDVNSHDYCINAQLMEKELTSRTVAVMPVHVFGLPCYMTTIMRFAQEHDLRVIEDSCECMFASFEGRRVGSFGDVSAFSSYISHFIVTGVGGLACTSDDELAEIMRSYMNHGRDMSKPGFTFKRIGHSMRGTELEAALGCAQLDQWRSNVARRREIAGRYLKELGYLYEHMHLPETFSNRENNFMMFPIVLYQDRKKEMIEHLKERNVETRDMLPITNQECYRGMPFYGNVNFKYPVADRINRHGFYVGCHPYMTDGEVQWVIDSIKGFFSA